MAHALEVEHLSVAFGRTEVLRDLSFRVAQGSTLALIGPNGSGKTVLFRALVGDAIAARVGRPTGPVIIAVAAAFFFASLLVRRDAS